MSRSVYIIGGPGTGKSTLMDSLVPALGLHWLPDRRVWREIWVNPLSYSGELEDLDGYCLGKHRKGFAGTDALSLSASPRAKEWLDATELPDWVLGEGMRLGHPTFLAHLAIVTDLTVVYLEAENDTTRMRLANRGHQFEDSFVQAARTRAYNAAQACELLGIPLLAYPSDVLDPEQIAARILSELMKEPK